MDKAAGQVAGVDVGGTFTDLVQIDPATGAVRLAKVASTPDNQAFGVLNALSAAETDLAALSLIVHGTTTTTNAVLERKLARTGLITTAGFRDVLELGRRTRPQPYSMKGAFRPIIPRDLRREVPERMDAAGAVVTPLDEPALRAAAETLLAQGCEALVVHFLHAYANPAHELRAAEILRALWPNDHITLGHALLSESREFERGVTAAVNASVQPLLARYIRRLETELAEGGYAGDLLVMNGNGGMVSSRTVADEAAKTVMSGPASGVMAAAYTGRVAGMENLITYDMGGTSTDVALIRNAEPQVSNETEIEYAMPIHVPMVDVRSVGAGGGSIARVNAAGLLEVGPQSAGADPGPICYGLGGTDPTISDANLLLGRLDPARINVTGGVSLDDIRRIFADRLGTPLGLSPEDAAAAVIRVANTRMAGAIRMVSLSLGADPRDFALFAFGGAGPLHAAALARELGIPRVLVPPRPGITNAIGCVVADLRHDYVRTINTPLDQLDMADLRAVFDEQAAEGAAAINAETLRLADLRRVHSVDMQFIGQTHLIRVPVPDPQITREALQTAFERVYFARFRVALDEIRASVVNANSSVIGTRPPVDLSTLLDPSARRVTLDAARVATRPVTFDSGPQDTPVYRREHLPPEARITGPAVVEQMDTTLLIEPGDTATADPHGNLILEVAR
ncbi:hydantoinase/oxoprolinase family protein [Psychromarinibacter sp. C21-152]|uniref:Hydantoinase/oxoprolinase family protein n=1 Tax=Psychromarinibacter sediminicola TaxID=3033385 RepID=A0AAE3NQM2_9RHOB|nr:hydantoinase/oxoprolinase family protein [Psychromarinibacter sediminicola]MDF0600664.1 hydantoinase/oxoprolinase family protein [Psychromarinibacter sediminicola]